MALGGSIKIGNMNLVAYFNCSIITQPFPTCFTDKELGERIRALKKDEFLIYKFNNREGKVLNYCEITSIIWRINSFSF